MATEPIHTHKDLDVWKKSVRLVVDLYKLTRIFPPDERFGLTSQIRRASTSVPANIAEGGGRGSTKEYIQFLKIARGSLTELETHLIVCKELCIISNSEYARIDVQVSDVAKMLNRLISVLDTRLATRERAA